MQAMRRALHHMQAMRRGLHHMHAIWRALHHMQARTLSCSSERADASNGSAHAGFSSTHRNDEALPEAAAARPMTP